jgi:hypothetical protein
LKINGTRRGDGYQTLITLKIQHHHPQCSHFWHVIAAFPQDPEFPFLGNFWGFLPSYGEKMGKKWGSVFPANEPSSEPGIKH